MSVLVTGGCGFIGSCFVLDWLARPDAEPLVNLDALTYAGNAANLAAAAADPRYTFVEGDIRNSALLAQLLREHSVTEIVHFAAESHVDRSILGPMPFLETNILGTATLLEAVRAYLGEVSPARRAAFRFLHVSTDEVYGSLAASAPAFTETSPYAPNSPYAASKAGSDHLARAWFHTYGVPVVITNCSNNYGPRQFPEKLIPLMLLRALDGLPLPVYGDGGNVRDWLYVEDHCAALRILLARGVPGEVYNIGGNSEMTNLDLVHLLCSLLDDIRPRATGSYALQIEFVADRPGHDRRYAINPEKMERELGWRPEQTLATGLRKTVEWYLANPKWVTDVTSGTYRNWIRANYEQRPVTAGAAL